MTSWADVFDAFEGPTELGLAIGVDRRHAAVMKVRGSIPPSYWSRLVAAGKPGITFDLLAKLAAPPQRSPEASE